MCPASPSASPSGSLAWLPLRRHRFSRSLVITLRVPPRSVLGPGTLSPSSSSAFFLPCFLLLQIVLSLLLATHQLHPRHLSQSFAYSVLITFPSSRQELPGASRWHLLLPCFPYSCHAHSFPTGCLWGSSITPFGVLGSLTFSSPPGSGFYVSGAPASPVSALPAFSLGSSYRGKRLFQPHSISATCCSVLSRASLRRRPCPSGYLHRGTNHDAFLSPHSRICHFS